MSTSNENTKKKKSLFEIVGDSLSIINEMLYQGGEFTEEMEDRFNSIENDLVEKIDNYYALIDRMDNEQKFLKEKSDEFLKASKVMKNTSARLKESIKDAMINLKKDEIIGETWRFKIGKLKDKMIINEKLVAEKYYSEKTESFIDKEKIIADLNFGQKVEGVSFIDNYSLRKTVAKKGKKK